MRALVIALVLGVTACGSKQGGAGGGAAAQVVSVFPAARYVPAQPTYVVSARSVRDAQAAFRATFELLGMTFGFEVSEVSRDLASMIGVDPFDADAVAALGVDLDGSVAMFSEGLNPTFVVPLKSAEAMTGFLDGQRQRGLHTQSVISAGIEVFTAKIASDVHISWAIDTNWMWVHFALGKQDGVAWFEASKQPTGAGWVEGWTWAKGLSKAAAPVIGLVDLHAVLEKIAAFEKDARVCARQVAVVRRVGLNFDASTKRLAAQVAFDLGDTSAVLARMLLPPPPGWTAAGTNAPISAQWNADLPIAAQWFGTCLDDDDLVTEINALGIRSARAFVHKLDPDDKEGVGAASADLSSAAYLRAQLDQIPGRGTFESSRSYGAYKGKHLSVPFVGKGDYVLTDTIAIAAMGDGLLAAIGTGAAASAPPAVFSVDLRPPGLSAGVWQFIAEQLDIDEPKRFAQRLLLWSDLHVGGRLDGTTLVIDAHGNRR